MDYEKIANEALEARARLVSERRSVNEDSTLSDAEKRERFERLDADIDARMNEAREAVQAGEREAEHRDLMGRAGALGDLRTPGQDRSAEAEAFNDSLRSVARGDLREFRFTPGAEAFEKRATTMVSDGAGANKAGTAGPVTPDTFVATLLESLEESSDVLAKVRKISTSSGEPMNWPRRVSKAGNTFQKIQEAGTYQSTTDGSFDLFTLLAFKFGAIAEISDEAVSDPALNVGQIVAQEMGEDLADSLAAEVWDGNGLSETILGNVINTVSLAGHAVTYDELIDLQHSVISKYRRNAGWTLNDLTARDIRKIKDGDGNYIWQPAVVAGQPDLLLGKPVATDPNIPTLDGMSVNGIVFGDLGRAYTLRNVRNIGIVRSDEYGFDRDTTALKIRWRGDGGVSDPEAYATAVTPAT